MSAEAEPPYDVGAFDARFRWVIRQEMLPLKELRAPFEVLEATYINLRDRIVNRLRGEKTPQNDVPIVVVKIYAKRYVVAMLSELERGAPEPVDAPIDMP